MVNKAPRRLLRNLHRGGIFKRSKRCNVRIIRSVGTHTLAFVSTWVTLLHLKGVWGLFSIDQKSLRYYRWSDIFRTNNTILVYVDRCIYVPGLQWRPVECDVSVAINLVPWTAALPFVNCYVLLSDYDNLKEHPYYLLTIVPIVMWSKA